MFVLTIAIDVLIDVAGRLVTTWERATRTARRCRSVVAPIVGGARCTFVARAVSYSLTADLNFAWPTAPTLKGLE